MNDYELMFAGHDDDAMAEDEEPQIVEQWEHARFPDDEIEYHFLQQLEREHNELYADNPQTCVFCEQADGGADLIEKHASSIALDRTLSGRFPDRLIFEQILAARRHLVEIPIAKAQAAQRRRGQQVEGNLKRATLWMVYRHFREHTLSLERTTRRCLETCLLVIEDIRINRIRLISENEPGRVTVSVSWTRCGVAESNTKTARLQGPQRSHGHDASSN